MASIRENQNFDLTAACKDLYFSIKGLGTDKEKLIQVLTSCNNAQRQRIKEKYKFMYSKELKEDIDDERGVSSDLKVGLFSLICSSHEYDAVTLHNSLHVLTSESLAFFECIKNRTNVKPYAIIEIMATRSSEELERIQEFYKKKYKKDLDRDFKKSFFMSHSLIKLLRTLAIQKRLEDTEINESQIAADAKCILNSENIAFSYESELVRLFTSRSFPHLSRILDEYSKLTGNSLNDKLSDNNELESDFKECLSALIECAIDIPTYFAKRLHEYLEYKYGAKDKSVIRVIVTRSEKDLSLVKDRYFELYKQKLVDVVANKTNGSYQHLLKVIIGN